MSNLIHKNEKGIVLATGLMFLAIIAIVGTTAVLITTTDLKIGSNYRQSEQAFYAAEAGIQRAANALKAGVSNGFNDELLGTDGTSGTSDDGQLFGPDPVPFGDGNYAVKVTDNDDGDGDPFSDPDNKVIITSTGTVNNASKTIEAVFSFQQIGVDGALGVYGDGPIVELSGASEIDGRDYNVPSDFDCSGAGCTATLAGGAPAPGIYAEEAITQKGLITDETDPKQNIFGDPPIDDGGGGEGSVSYWQDFANSLTPDLTVDSATEGTITENIFGSRNNPQITIITDSAGTGTHLSGTIDGAGILIVNGDLQITGTFHFEGLIIVMSGGDLVVTGTGRSITYGSVVLAGSGVSSEVDYGGHASIRYSSQALSYAANTLAGLDSWREM